MWTQMWSGLGGKLADRWLSVAGPALVFWLGGLAAYGVGNGFDGAKRVVDDLGRESLAAQLVWIALLLVAVQASALVVARVTLPVLRLLEGYWPAPLARGRIRSITQRLEAEAKEWQALMAKETLDAAEERRKVELDERRRRCPSIERLLPTRLGNRIRAAEDAPNERYGLDAVLTWGHLWLLLPETTRAELVAARSALDRAVAGVIWSALFILFSFWTLWAIPVGVLGILLITLFWLPAQADRYAALILAAFDMYRFELYKAAHWPLPATPDDELRTGPLLTRHLYRGDPPASLRYDHGQP